MKCPTVRHKLAGYLEDGLAAAASNSERIQMRQHLDACAPCREELQRYRKLSLLLSRAPRVVPPADLAIRIKVATAKSRATQGWRHRWSSVRDRIEILQDNVFRPLTVPATGGFFSAILVFADRFVLFEQDREVGDEARWQAIGRISGKTLLLVAHTYEDDEGEETIRIISARRAATREREVYDRQFHPSNDR